MTQIRYGLNKGEHSTRIGLVYVSCSCWDVSYLIPVCSGEARMVPTLSPDRLRRSAMPHDPAERLPDPICHPPNNRLLFPEHAKGAGTMMVHRALR